MKLSLLFLSYFNAELITPNNEKYCYGTGVSLGDHNYMGRPKYTNDVDGCSQQCSRDRRCNFFTYESSKQKCLLYRNKTKLRNVAAYSETLFRVWFIKVKEENLFLKSNPIFRQAKRTSALDVFELAGIMAMWQIFLMPVITELKAVAVYSNAQKFVFTLNIQTLLKIIRK